MSSPFGENEIEAFKEAGNIGAGHAAIALTKLFARDVDMSIPFVRHGNTESILDEAKIDKDMLVAYEALSIDDPVKYKLSVFFKPQSVLSIINLLTTTKLSELTDPSQLTKMQKSLIQEVGSTIILRYIAALNKMMRVDIVPKHAPDIKFDKAKKAFDTLFTDEGNDIFLIQLDLFTEEQKFECQLFIQPSPETIEEYRKAFYLN
ncbi:MAG: hypothetical protein D6732_06875 [Methanobacteriota archaeon]|nr:MAG: hypothetical protein D6732_06875 [Euryarchaeota archaeon]